MKTYQELKSEYLKSKVETENAIIYRARLEGFEMAEKLIEDQVRNNLGPLANFLQTVSQIIDTKKEEKRETLLAFLTDNQGTIKRLKEIMNKLINIARL